MQTAIEWLLENVPERFKNAFMNSCQEEIEQAKKMEKEQLKEMYLKGIENYDPTFKRKPQE